MSKCDRPEIQDQLNAVKEWAKEKIAQGKEPPWATVQYNKLINVVTDILAAQAVTISLEDSLLLESRREPAPPQGANIRHIDSARRHPVVQRVRMPM
jgi:hypothetical protein